MRKHALYLMAILGRIGQVRQGNHPQMKMGMKLATLVAMTAIAVMTLASAKPAFAHGPQNPMQEGPDKTWHLGMPNGHNGGHLWCYSSPGKLVATDPNALPLPTNPHGRGWWSYSIDRWDSASSQWQTYTPYIPFRTFVNNSGRFFDLQGSFSTEGVPSGYYRVVYEIAWEDYLGNNQYGYYYAWMHASEYWQGVNGSPGSGIQVASDYCQVF